MPEIELPEQIVAIVAEAAGQHGELRQRLAGYLEGKGEDPAGWKLVVDSAHLVKEA